MDETESLARIRQLPCWRGTVDVSALAGGMTNRNFLVRDRGAGDFVVRVGRDLPEHGVMRFNELAAARAAYAAGISPEVVHAGDGLMVSRYVPGRTLTAEDIREPRTLARVVSLVRQCHLGIPHHFRGPALVFWVFQVIRNYLGLLSPAQCNPLQLDLARFARLGEALEREVGPITIVFGHNDLLAANFIDDGDRLWLIDWDYAGFNSGLFDLANLASNNGFGPELDQALLEAYFQDSFGAASQRAFAAMKCASLLRELLWAAVSQLHSQIEFDYAAYARDYLARFESSWDALQSGTAPLQPSIAQELSRHG